MAISGGQQRLDWYAVPGVPLTIVLDTADGADWASAPIVHVGPIEADGDITPVIPAQTATITATASRATLTLTDAQMAAILTAYPVAARTACPWHVRLGTGESELAVSTGHIIWDTTGRMVTTSAQLVVGPPGLTAVSADAGNAASLGTDGLIYVAPGAGTVSSVNGQTGAVVLGAADVGADPAGTMAAHLAAVDPHPQYATDTDLTTGLAGKVGTGDARLTDQRTPTAHAASHAKAGTDALSVLDLASGSTDTTKVFGPSATGGVQLVTPAAGAATVRWAGSTSASNVYANYTATVLPFTEATKVGGGSWSGTAYTVPTAGTYLVVVNARKKDNDNYGRVALDVLVNGSPPEADQAGWQTWDGVSFNGQWVAVVTAAAGATLSARIFPAGSGDVTVIKSWLTIMRLGD